MHWSQDKVEMESLKNGEMNPGLPRRSANPTAGAEDPAARQRRKLALMASLSEGLPTLPAYVFELNTLLAATPARKL